MIPQNIINPSGCGRKFNYKMFGGNLICNKDKVCHNCKNIQKAQAQVLLDEKKLALIWLNNLNEVIGLDDMNWGVFNHKIQELQEEIKILTKLNGGENE